MRVVVVHALHRVVDFLESREVFRCEDQVTEVHLLNKLPVCSGRMMGRDSLLA